MIGPTYIDGRDGTGPLQSVNFAVKDLFDVAGYKCAAGNPDWLAKTPVAQNHAPAVLRLIEAGATLVGTTITDELAFSLSGTNVHYGTPLNPRAPGRIPGGSSSGSASAVAAGTVPVALGTDTAGSTRVPASYCGIWGFRPSFGRISTRGVVPLAPRFDTVGILTNSGTLLGDVFNALCEMPTFRPTRSITRLVLATDLLALTEPDFAWQFTLGAELLASLLDLSLEYGTLLGTADLAACQAGFRAQQLPQVWQCHGEWISTAQPRFGPGVAARFAAAAQAPPTTEPLAAQLRALTTMAFEATMGSDALVICPVTSSTAPLIDLNAPEKERLRSNTLALTAPAGIVGAPQLVCPMASLNGLPIGIGVLGLPGEDELLVSLAARLASRESSAPSLLSSREAN